MGSLLIIHIRDSLTLLSSVSKIEFLLPLGALAVLVRFSRRYGVEFWRAFSVGGAIMFEMTLKCVLQNKSRLLQTLKNLQEGHHSTVWISSVLHNPSLQVAETQPKMVTYNIYFVWVSEPRKWNDAKLEEMEMLQHELCHLVLRATRWPNKYDILSWFLKT